jgi:hypothetical protein
MSKVSQKAAKERPKHRTLVERCIREALSIALIDMVRVKQRLEALHKICPETGREVIGETCEEMDSFVQTVTGYAYVLATWELPMGEVKGGLSKPTLNQIRRMMK